MKNIAQISLVIIFLFYSGTAIFCQNTEDTTFIGYWELSALHETGDQVFHRCDSLGEDSQGFQILQNETVVLYKKNSENNLFNFKGSWWSLRMKRMDIQYFDSTINQMVIEGFEYISSNDNHTIMRVRYDEYQRTKDSGFSGHWRRVSAPNSDETVFERCDSLDIYENGFFLNSNEEVIRRIQSESKKTRFNEFIGIWWSFSNDYFDIQYYDEKKKQIIIEGYRVIENSNQMRLKRTRYEELEKE